MQLKERVILTNFDKKTTTWLILMHAGCLLAPFTFTWDAFWVFIGLYVLTGGVGVCIGLHRLLTHRSFKTPKYFEYFLTILGCLSAQRSPIYWVARHRQHHADPDGDDDPHSPRHGFWWSHVLWIVADRRVEDENEFYKNFCPELASDPGHRWIQKTHEIWPVALAGVLFLIGGLPFLVWGVFVRTTFVYQITWFVNSASHIWGYRNYDTKDDSTNNWWVALLSFGEGWHNNHHAYQTLAHHGAHKWWEYDPGYWMIQLFSLVGLASDIRKK